MIKSFIYAAILLSFISCHTYRMLDGKSRPVYFTPDATVFNDSDFPARPIIYQDLLNLRGNYISEVELKNGKTSIAIIPRATFFWVNDAFLVYPGEHISVKKGKYQDYTLSKIHGSKRRNKELSFLKTFHQIESYPVSLRLNNSSRDSILALEKKLKSEMPKIAVYARLLFDSLAKDYRVSKKFKKIAGDFLENQQYIRLYGLYQQYKDSLQAHDLYKNKLMQLLPIFNSITETSKFNGVSVVFNEVAEEVLPVKIHKIKNETEFQTCFDFIENNFTALAKNYLLSELMYWTYTKGIYVNADYLKKYETACSDKTYKRLVYNLKSQQEQNNKTNTTASNALLLIDGKKTSSIESILAKYKGKLILIDFWATWCAPCRKEMPYLQKLMQNYPKDEIIFLSISIERETQTWQKYVIANNTEISNNYLMIDQEKSSFIKQFGINSIPRYMLIDKEGQIINPEAPNPSDPKLKEQIDKNLKRM
jgi:thiol-disulfide isomerase/thioredoxin